VTSEEQQFQNPGTTRGDVQPSRATPERLERRKQRRLTRMDRRKAFVLPDVERIVGDLLARPEGLPLEGQGR